MPSVDFNSLLLDYGLLCHTFAYNELPNNIKNKLGEKNRSRYQDCYLSLFANAGPRFWVKLKAEQSQWSDERSDEWTEKQSINREALNNPVDHFSKILAERCLQLAGLNTNAEILYPGNAPAPLMLLGELANWSTPSKLGLGLHPRYGPWFAYRALVKTIDPLQSHTLTSNLTHNSYNPGLVQIAQNLGSRIDMQANAQTSPCVQCDATPCVSACPGKAVTNTASFDIGLCAGFRIKENSVCAEQCHARNACPVGSEYQYSEEQRAYHMTHALQALVEWATKK